MNRFTVYRSGRGGGKTTWLINQMAGLLSAADGPLNIALVVPTAHFIWQFRERHVPVAIYTEQDVREGKPRGHQYDMVFVDNADLFYEYPLDLCDEVAPGKPAFLTYTPFEGSSLPKPLPKPEPPLYRWDEDEYAEMIMYMLAYIYTAHITDDGWDRF